MNLIINFFKTNSGFEPVRQWLVGLSQSERKIIGEDLKTVQLGWPIGMPLVRKIATGLWEVRVTLPGKIARILFTVVENRMVLLHGFIKKTQATPKGDLDLAVSRLKQQMRSNDE